MDAGPRVEVRVGDDAAARWAAGAVLAAAAVILIAWALAWAGASAHAQATAAAVGALAGVAVGVWARRHRPRATACLRGDGRRWQWVSAGGATPVEGALSVAIDLDAWLLLRFDGADGLRRWIALSRAQHGARWHALRCAVCARGADARPIARLPL
jgi:hypothetical protein